METRTLQMVDPESLLGDDNSRFGLKKPRVERLMADIIAQGEVHTALDVEMLPEPVNGFVYRINDGHYRQAAAIRLNKEQSAGLLVPINIVAAMDPTLRLKRQISFNVEREDPSPMDNAVSIRRLLDAGVSRQEIRNIFKRAGGRKGDKVQPASNSYLNMMLSFLEFPKNIQNLIHSGIITVGGAYKLSTKPKEKWAEIVAECEKEREDEDKREEKDEEKYLAGIKKEADAEEKEKKLKADAEAAKAKLTEAAAALDVAAHAEAAAMTVVRKGALDDEAKKAAAEALKLAQQASKDAVLAAEKAKKEAESAQAKIDKLAEATKERAEKLADLRKAAAKSDNKPQDGKKAIGAAAIDKKGPGLVALNATQMRAAVAEWALPGAPKLQAIFLIVQKCFAGEGTPNLAFSEMVKITGESAPKKKK